ncbi:MAG: hypothetical protein HZA63_11365 [Rhodocyclales bacterium]|nr:hypothetical protein [Rhodocyclales bacterium]
MFRCEAAVLARPGSGGDEEPAGRHVSSIAQESRSNSRLGGERSLEEFRALMAALKLPYPKFIDYAVPANRQCGVCPSMLPMELEKYCRRMAASPQG